MAKFDRELIDRALKYANAKDEARGGESGEGTTLLRCLCLALEETGASLARAEAERDRAVKVMKPIADFWKRSVLGDEETPGYDGGLCVTFDFTDIQPIAELHADLSRDTQAGVSTDE